MKRQPSEQGNIFIDNNSIEDWCQEYTKDSKRVNAKKTIFFKQDMEIYSEFSKEEIKMYKNIFKSVYIFKHQSNSN